MSTANDTDQDFIQQNCLQVQEKYNTRLGPKSPTTVEMQLNECQYVMCVASPDASHGFTWNHGTIKKLLNNGISGLIQLIISGKFIMGNRVHIKVSSLTTDDVKNMKSKMTLLH